MEEQRQSERETHTKTGLVERHIGLLKLTMRKLAADALSEGIALSPADLAAEACVAHNVLLTYNGVVPAAGVFGTSPPDLFDLGNLSTDNATDDTHHDGPAAVA